MTMDALHFHVQNAQNMKSFVAVIAAAMQSDTHVQVVNSLDQIKGDKNSQSHCYI